MDANKFRDPLLATVANKTIPAAVRRASGWALLTACATLASFAVGHVLAYALVHYKACCTESSVFLHCVQWTDVEAAGESALWFWMLFCAVLQVAAAELARHLPCRHRWVRRALAYLALVVTLFGHCIYAVHVRLILAADPGHVFVWILGTADIAIFAGGDLLCFMGLLLGGDN